METVLKYEKVAKKDNRKVMLGCEEIATGEDFKVYQSANKNVITIAKSDFFYHIILQQIVDSVLCADSAQPKMDIETLINQGICTRIGKWLKFTNHMIPENELSAQPKDTCTCKEPKQTYPGQDYCRRCGELIKGKDTDKEKPHSLLMELYSANKQLKEWKLSLLSLAEHHEAEVKDLKQEIKDRIDTELSLTKWLDELGERLDWFDNLVEYKVKGKHTCLKDYVEGLEKRVTELETAIKSILHWKARAETTPEMLLSTQPDKSDVCIEIMRNYEESFKTALQALKDKGK